MTDFNKRIDKIRKSLPKTNGASMLISSPPNISYLTGMRDIEGILCLTRNSSCFFTSSIYSGFANDTIKIGAEIIELRKKNFRKVLSGHKKIFFIPSELSCQKAAGWTKTTGRKFLPVKKDPVKILRAIKDPDEIEKISKSVNISKNAFNELKKFIKPGVTEIETVGYFLYLIRKKWHARESFPPIVAFGENSAFPHHTAKDRKLKQNDIVLIDFGVIYQGYHSDLTRTYSVGRPDNEFLKAYKIAEDVQKRVIEKIGKEKNCGKLFAYAYNLFERQNLGKNFLHGLGHGIGLEIHEAPSLSLKSTDTLKENMVVTIEPGIYLKGYFGIRIEDDVLIGKTGYRVL